MWLQIGLASGAVAVAWAMVRRWRRRTTKIDVGPVSEAWLAEQRGRSRET